MSSEVLSRPVSHGAACGGGRWMIFLLVVIFFPCYFSLSQQKCTPVFFSFHFSILVLRFFIVYFCPWLF